MVFSVQRQILWASKIFAPPDLSKELQYPKTCTPSGAGKQGPYRAVNSSKVSSWCSLRRGTEMLKLRLEPAMRAGTKEALARVGATGRFARKNVLEGPARAAMRSREVEDIFFPETGGGTVFRVLLRRK